MIIKIPEHQEEYFFDKLCNVVKEFAVYPNQFITLENSEYRMQLLSIINSMIKSKFKESKEDLK